MISPGCALLGDLIVHEAGPVTDEQFNVISGDTAIIIGQIDLSESRLTKAPCLRAILNVEGNFLTNVDESAIERVLGRSLGRKG